MKPTFTLTYGLGWNLEMPPYELHGSQVALVDSNNQPISTTDFLAQRQTRRACRDRPTRRRSATRWFATSARASSTPTIRTTANSAPRASFAWNPHFSDGILGKLFGNGKTVVRGGYGRIFGRLNGVDLVLVPLLGPGLLQGVICSNPLSNGTCAGSGVATPANAFRIGTDGMTAPLAAASPDPSAAVLSRRGQQSGNRRSLRPRSDNFRPDRTDNFTLTVQRELNSHMQLEVGYIGKILRNEFMEMNLDSVPYMTTLGGQSFSQPTRSSTSRCSSTA